MSAVKAVGIRENVLNGPHGPLRVRTYTPSSSRGVGLVWIHGGAFFMNDIDVPEVRWVSTELAKAGVTVVSPDYRLAGDGVHFPVLTDECRAAWDWATTSVEPSHVDEWHIGGGSAGGNLAAAVTMILRDTGAALPLSNILVYPALHSPFPPPSAELNAKLATLPPEELYAPERVRQINLNYVGDSALLQHPYAFPGHGELRGMPPTLVVNAEYDPIRSSGESYAAQLAQSGVDVLQLREPRAHHGHLNHPDDPAAQSTVGRMLAWLLTPLLRGEGHDRTHPAETPSSMAE